MSDTPIISPIVSIETKRIIISPITKSNYENVTELFANSKDSGYATGIFDEISQEEVEKRISFGDSIKKGFNLSAISKCKKELVGFLRGSLSEKAYNAWIYTFIITDKYRRNGYGTEFAEAVSNVLYKEYGVKRIGLSVLDKNFIGKSFWESMGYEMIETLMKSGIGEESVSKINIYAKLF